MKLSRRECLQISLGGATLGALGWAGGCAPLAARLTQRDDVASPLPSGPTAPELRLLNRSGFGPRPGDVALLASQGRISYVDQCLAAAQNEPLTLSMQLHRLDALQIDAYELRDLPEDTVLSQLQQAAILRATHGANPLLERMVDFWTNHFNVYGRKGLAAYRKGRDENDVVRKHALGKFPDLLRASTQSSAMLVYLDNQLNHKGIPNENYARELMELHSLGVHGGYTQRDVQEVARCLSGWTLDLQWPRNRGRLKFEPSLHDDGVKTVLGKTIPPGGGAKDLDQVVSILCAHPACAHYISTKLCRYLLGAGPEAARWVEPTATVFRQTGGDIRAMIRPILLSDDLTTGPLIMKRPFDLAVSLIRALGGVTDGGRPIQEHLIKMGEPLYQWPMPDGYPDRTSAWAGSLLPRWNFAAALGRNQIGGTDIDLEALASRGSEGLFELTHGRRPNAEDHPVMKALTHLSDQPKLMAAVALSSPAMQWR